MKFGQNMPYFWVVFRLHSWMCQGIPGLSQSGVPSMTSVYELINNAITLIAGNQFMSAMNMINEALCLDPNNLQVWEIYLQIQNTPEELQLAKERILNTKELCIPDEFGLLTYQCYLFRRIEAKTKNLVP
jgi:hypothetical protein